MYIIIRKYTRVRSVADAARRAKSGIGQVLKESHGFRSYYVLDGGGGVGVAVMIFEDRESANAANHKVLEFVQASLHDLNLGDPEIIAGEVLVDIESDHSDNCPGSAQARLSPVGPERNNATTATTSLLRVERMATYEATGQDKPSKRFSPARGLRLREAFRRLVEIGLKTKK